MIYNVETLLGCHAFVLTKALTISQQHLHPYCLAVFEYHGLVRLVEKRTTVRDCLERSDFENRQEYVSLNIPVKYQVITTFHQAGYNLYANKMIDTWLATWPSSVGLKVYAERCEVTQRAPNLEILDLESACPDLVTFKNTWSSVPRATGDISGDPIRSQRKDHAKSFKWDAVRFAHKVYAVFHAVKTAKSEWVLWMDADMVCHSALSEEFLDTMCPSHQDLCFLGRPGKFSECGLYAMHIGTKGTTRFIKEFQRMYNEAENGIFTLGEWHDSFVFDAVRARIDGLQQLNWSERLGDLRRSPANSLGEGHPLINSAWGAYLDHLKGDNRKQAGHSLRQDIKVQRQESYWQNIR